MALPKLNDAPQYEMVIPSSKTKVMYRPYLVKEEKIMLMAAESQDPKAAMMAMVDTIVACVSEDIQPTDLTSFDVEYMFTQIRSKSVGETAEVILPCSECETKNDAFVSLISAQVTDAPESNIIELSPRISLEMKYPSFNDYADVYKDDIPEAELAFSMIEKCISAVLTEDERYDISESNPKELKDFIESMTNAQFEKVGSYFQQMPKLVSKCEFTCTECGHENSIDLEGLQSFF
jgi:hypothetical protein